jgi:hypothetical protein
MPLSPHIYPLGRDTCASLVTLVASLEREKAAPATLEAALEREKPALCPHDGRRHTPCDAGTLSR